MARHMFAGALLRLGCGYEYRSSLISGRLGTDLWEMSIHISEWVFLAGDAKRSGELKCRRICTVTPSGVETGGSALPLPRTPRKEASKRRRGNMIIKIGPYVELSDFGDGCRTLQRREAAASGPMLPTPPRCLMPREDLAPVTSSRAGRFRPSALGSLAAVPPGGTAKSPVCTNRRRSRAKK